MYQFISCVYQLFPFRLHLLVQYFKDPWPISSNLLTLFCFFFALVITIVSLYQYEYPPQNHLFWLLAINSENSSSCLTENAQTNNERHTWKWEWEDYREISIHSICCRYLVCIRIILFYPSSHYIHHRYHLADKQKAEVLNQSVYM